MGILKISSEYFCEMSQLNETQSYTLGTYTTCKPEISLKGPWPEESKQSRSTARGNLRTIRITVAILASVTVIVGTTFGIIQSTKKPVVQPATTASSFVQLTMETDFSHDKDAPGAAPHLEIRTCGGLHVQSSLIDWTNKRVYSFNGVAEDLFIKFWASNNDGWQVKGLQLQKCKGDVCIEEEVLATKERTFKPFWIDSDNNKCGGPLPCFKQFVLKKSDGKWYITSNLNDNNCE